MPLVCSPHCRIKSKRQFYILLVFGFLRPFHCLTYKRQLICWTVVCCFCFYGYKWNTTRRSFYVLFNSRFCNCSLYLQVFWMSLFYIFFFSFNSFYWSIVDLQCCVSVCLLWSKVTLNILFHCGLSQDIKYSSLCCAVGPCLPIPHIEACTW